MKRKRVYCPIVKKINYDEFLASKLKPPYFATPSKVGHSDITSKI
jgi:hypothetical protein